jgi:hypothetical protein
MYTTLNADRSAALLAHRIRQRLPFFYLRYGDGAIECITGMKGRTCDFEHYSPALGRALMQAWDDVVHGENVYVGDWLSASFENGLRDRTRYELQYRALIGSARPNWLHFEALLLMRESQQLMDFYRAIRQDPRPKLYMGPAENRAAAEMLGADFLETPMENLFAHIGAVAAELLRRDFQVLLYGAGMAGNIAVAQCWAQHPARTYVHLGSAMDPLFRGRTRMRQLPATRARMLFAEFFECPRAEAV